MPEPLIGDVPENHPVLTNKRIVTGTSGKHITINGHNCLNLGTHNYLGLLNSPDIRENAIAAVHKYGVGSCGPRGFYGTIGKTSIGTLWLILLKFIKNNMFFHDSNVRCALRARRAIGQIHANGRIRSIFVWIFNGCQCDWSLLQARWFAICVSYLFVENVFQFIFILTKFHPISVTNM